VREKLKSHTAKARATLKEKKIIKQRGAEVALFKTTDQLKKEIFLKLDEYEYNVEDFYKAGTLAHWIAVHPKFNNITLLIIVFNVVWIGCEAEFNNGENTGVDIWFVGEYTFLVFYTFEIAVRFMAFATVKYAFSDYWFIFDFLLVLVMLIENIFLPLVYAIMGTAKAADLSFMNIMKLFRLLRLFRVVRVVRTVPELMTVMKSMAAAIRSVTAVCILLTGSVYVFAVVFRLVEGTTCPACYDLVSTGADVGRYDTLLWAIFTLVEATLSGEFPNSMGLIINHQTLKQVLFLFHLLFSHTLMLSMLIGLMCQIVTSVGLAQREKIAVQECRAVLEEHFDQVDSDRNGVINQEEFHELLSIEAVQFCLMNMDIDVMHWRETAAFIFDSMEFITFGRFLEVALSMRAINPLRVSDVVELRKSIFAEMHETQKSARNTNAVMLHRFHQLEKRHNAFRKLVAEQMDTIFELLGVGPTRSPSFIQPGAHFHDGSLFHADAHWETDGDFFSPKSAGWNPHSRVGWDDGVPDDDEFEF
jgi:hypothetical protein